MLEPCQLKAGPEREENMLPQPPRPVENYAIETFSKTLIGINSNDSTYHAGVDLNVDRGYQVLVVSVLPTALRSRGGWRAPPRTGGVPGRRPNVSSTATTGGDYLFKLNISRSDFGGFLAPGRTRNAYRVRIAGREGISAACVRIILRSWTFHNLACRLEHISEATTATGYLIERGDAIIKKRKSAVGEKRSSTYPGSGLRDLRAG
jgi:hypothetical protein